MLFQIPHIASFIISLELSHTQSPHTKKTRKIEKLLLIIKKQTRASRFPYKNMFFSIFLHIFYYFARYLFFSKKIQKKPENKSIV